LGKLWSKIVFLWINFIILLKCFFDLTQSNLNIFQFCKFILIQKFNSIPMKNCFRKISHHYYTHIHTSWGGGEIIFMNQGTKIKYGTSKGRVFQSFWYHLPKKSIISSEKSYEFFLFQRKKLLKKKIWKKTWFPKTKKGGGDL